jgi:7,8-dihydropterin-6-yl-methyl-4-(beta-D-ribofuranosyl)aminobenzene 5'-phosphate synthase
MRSMRTTHLSVLAALGSAVLILTSCAATESSAAATPVAVSPRITVLYDAFGKDSMMTKDWGYAALVEISGKRILFDTGDNP